MSGGVPIVASGSYDTSPGNSHDLPIPAGHAVGVYRLLAGAGYHAATVAFTGVPTAVAPEVYNRSEAVYQVRVAYGYATSYGHVP